MKEQFGAKRLDAELKSGINPRCLNCRPLIMAAVQIAEVAANTKASNENTKKAFDNLLDPTCEGPRPDSDVASCSIPNCSHNKGATYLIKITREIHGSNDIFATIN
jgi:hypothetical protein